MLMHSAVIVTAVLLPLVQFAGRAASFVLDDAVAISFSFGQQLCSVEEYVRVAQCDNASSDTQQRFVGTSRTTERVLFGSPDELLQCDEDARNQSFWTWSVNCSSQVWSSHVKAQLDKVRLTARRDITGRWVLGASNLEALRNNCVVVVHPVLHLDIRPSVYHCQPAQPDPSVAANGHYPLAVMYRPLVSNSGSIQVSVTYSLQLEEGQWLTTCGANATFYPRLDACLPPLFAANSTPACDSWIRFDHFVPASALEHGVTVLHNGTTFSLESHQYELNNEHQWLYVCETELVEPPEEPEDWQRQVERCLFIISALADLANILVHLTLRAQRTLPGRIVLCLSGTLFASDLSCFLLTFLRSVETLWVCFAVRSVAHYLSLCASCWTQVLWYDLWQTISASRAVDSCRHVHTRFYRYVVFSWVIPLLFPATRLVVDVHSTLYMPGDDENAELKRLMVCNQQPLVYYLTFSAIPVSCILVMNTVFLTRSCCLIRRVVQDTERVGISNNFMNAQQQFGLYTKLFFLCGFTSLFGFVSEILKNQNVSESLTEVFLRFSGILDSSLGLCVSLPFLCEPRVGIRFIRAIFMRKPQPPRGRNAAKVIINRDGTSPGLCNHV